MKLTKRASKLLAVLCIAMTANGFYSIQSFAGENPIRPVVQMILDQKNSENQFKKITVQSNKKVPDSYYDAVKDAFTSPDEVLFKLDQDALSDILDKKYDLLSLELNVGTDKSYILELMKVNIFSDDFAIEVSEGDPMEIATQVHYRGMIEDDINSQVAISFFENEMMGFINSEGDGTYVLGRLDGENTENVQIAYNENLLQETFNFECKDADGIFDLPDNYGQLNVLTNNTLNKCIKVYEEVDYDIYQSKSAGTGAYITGAFNQVATLYNNEGILIQLSQIHIWVQPSPYVWAANLQPTLQQFGTVRPTYNGNIAQLLSFKPYGGIAWVSGLCSSQTYDQGVCCLHSSYSTVPTYSWTVNVMAHEMGHTFSSWHTHDCVWNGNSTAIDGCGPNAGYPPQITGCAQGPIPQKGTIMSYCHLSPNTGINFSLGFGTQPGNVLRTNVINASCLCNSPGFISPVTSFCIPSGSTVQGYNIIAATGATSYTYTINPSNSPAYFQANSLRTYTTASTSFNLVLPSNNYSFTLTVQATGSCCNVTKTITIAVAKNVPSVNIFTQAASSSPCPAYKVMCTLVPGATYQWCTSGNCSQNCFSNGSWFTTTNYSGDLLTNCDGGYAYHVKVTNPCGTTTYCKIVNAPCSQGCPVRQAAPGDENNNQVEGTVSIQVIPNPANGSFDLEINSSEAYATVKLFNVLGMEIANFQTDKKRINFDGTLLPSGLCTAMVIVNNKIATQKIQIVH